jgi:hypothetical protein
MSTFPRSLPPLIIRNLRYAREVRPRQDKHARYEQRKAAWIHQHPDATSAEYEAAMCRIARACGV